MTDRSLYLLEILRIGHATSMRGPGLSLREALRRTQYKDRRTSFEPPDLRSLLHMEPGLVEQWLAYSEDKRTSAGWYLLRTGEMGRFGYPDSRKYFECLEEAVAEYVVLELDFWAGLQGAGQLAVREFMIEIELEAYRSRQVVGQASHRPLP